MDVTDSKITDQLSGRTIDHVIRNGKQLEFVTTDGHVVVLQSDINYNIQHFKTDVRIVLPGVSMFGEAGKL